MHHVTKIARTNCQCTEEVYMTPLTARAKFGMTRDLFFRACPLCIVTTFKVKKGDGNLAENHHCTIINGFADAIWDLVDCTISDRLSLMQSMRNSYAYQCFFNYCLNSDANREDYLFSTMAWKMDSGVTKADSETSVFKGDGIKNKAAAERATRIAGSRSVTVTNRLQCPLFTTSKALPTNMNVRVTLSKNSDKFLLIADEDDYKVEIQDVHLMVTFIRPHDIFHSLIEERLLKEPAPYIISKPEIIIKPISQSANLSEDLILIVYALYDRIIKISATREIEIID